MVGPSQHSDIIFAILGGLLSLAFPDRLIMVCCAILLMAGVLEYLQTLTPDRHGTIRDAFEKMGGGVSGALAAYVAVRW